MTDRKHPAAAFWITVALVAVLVGYPLSRGPILYLWTIAGQPIWFATAIDAVYYPLETAGRNAPGELEQALSAYGYWWMDLAEKQSR